MKCVLPPLGVSLPLFYLGSLHTSYFSLRPLPYTLAVKKQISKREFPGNPVARTHTFNARGLGSIPGRGTKILQAMWYSQKKKKENKNPIDCLSIYYKSMESPKPGDQEGLKRKFGFLEPSFPRRA